MPWSRGLTAATNSAALKTPRAPISVSCTPAFAAEPPVSCQTAWLSRLTMTSSPGRVSTRSATWLAIVPLGSQSAASLPSSAATLLLQAVDGRVLAVLVVADRRRGHRRAHLGRRAGDGVGAEDRSASSALSSACSSVTQVAPCDFRGRPTARTLRAKRRRGGSWSRIRSSAPAWAAQPVVESESRHRSYIVVITHCDGYRAVGVFADSQTRLASRDALP